MSRLLNHIIFFKLALHTPRHIVSLLFLRHLDILHRNLASHFSFSLFLSLPGCAVLQESILYFSLNQLLLLPFLVQLGFSHLVVEIAVVLVLILQLALFLSISKQGHSPVLCYLVQFLFFKGHLLADLLLLAVVVREILVPDVRVNLSIHDVPLAALHFFSRNKF